jgi:DNA-directed RNA polymerase
VGSGAIEFCSRKTSRLLSRVYSVPHFNFQRDDPVRALFLSADGRPIGEQCLCWLKLHVAGLGVMTSAIALAVWDAIRAAR